MFTFFLDANSRLAVWAARLGWSLPYFYATMDGTNLKTAGTAISYQCQRGNVRSQVSFEATGELQTAQPDNLEHFLLERYLLFVKRRHRIYMGQVHHVPYLFQLPKLVNWKSNWFLPPGLK